RQLSWCSPHIRVKTICAALEGTRRPGIILVFQRPSLEAFIMADPRRVEFGDFLRSRREKLSPKTVGLPAGRRRRTAGLRREEVAQLAGIGVDWYIRHEQGRT